MECTKNLVKLTSSGRLQDTRSTFKSQLYFYTAAKRASLIAQSIKNLPAMQETQVRNWVRTIPWRRKWQPTPVLLPAESHGQRRLAGYSPWVRKSRTQSSD